MQNLTAEELTRLKEGIETAYGIPFIDDIEDFIWEAIFSYMRDIPLVDPLLQTREKKLFDVVDKIKKIGWSAKAVQINAKLGSTFEVVIQRSDIFKKAASLGFSPLSLESHPSDLGNALMKNWVDGKIKTDMVAQGVDDARTCVLLKSKNRKTYTFVEQPVVQIPANELSWKWTNESKIGLQGWHQDQLKYRWYHGQTQFFEVMTIPKDAPVVSLEPKRLSFSSVISSCKGLFVSHSS